MKRFGRILSYLGAGFSFWIPSIIVHAFRGYHFGESRFDSIGVIILPVITSVLTLELLSKKMRGVSSRGAIAMWMLLGIWMLGPLCTMIGASFSGGGFTQPGTFYMLLLGIILFVPFTFMMSTYDMTLGALGVITIWFMVAGIISLISRLRRTPQSGAV